MSNEVTIRYEKYVNIIDRTGVYSLGGMLNKYSPQRKYDDPDARVEAMHFTVDHEDIPGLMEHTCEALREFGGNDYALILFMNTLIKAWRDHASLDIEVSGD